MLSFEFKYGFDTGLNKNVKTIVLTSTVDTS